MSDYTVRVLRTDEFRAARDLFLRALHRPPVKDEEWTHLRKAFQPGRALGAFDTELVGTVRSTDAEITVPGGKRVPLGAVTGVAVRADRTRRGLLTRLMRTQLADFAERGVVLAGLHATEGVIYGRYGYGVATVMRDDKVDKRRAVLRPEVPAGGEIELLEVDSAVRRLPEIYAALPHHRAGMMTRPPYWWGDWERRARDGDLPPTVVVHNGPSGVDGFATYSVRHSWDAPSVLTVQTLHTGTDDAFAGLWRYFLSVDLVDTIEAPDRPGDEPTALLFTDPRACSISGGGDDLWVRVVDVPGALAARTYEDAAPVVLEVEDPVLEANSGRYRIGPDGASRTDEAPQLALGVDALAMLYLGTWRASALAATGRLRVTDPEAVDRADRLFSTRRTAWCGTYF